MRRILQSRQAKFKAVLWLPLPWDPTQPYMIPNHRPLVFLMMAHMGVPDPSGCHGNQLCGYAMYYQVSGKI